MAEALGCMNPKKSGNSKLHFLITFDLGNLALCIIYSWKALFEIFPMIGDFFENILKMGKLWPKQKSRRI